jgi:hypothetical protein
MKKLLLSLILCMSLLTVGIGTALAETSLTTTMNTLYPGGWQQVQQDNVKFSATPLQAEVMAKNVNKQSGDTNALYWYDCNNPVITDQNLIFDNPSNNGGGDGGDVLTHVDPSNLFGLCIKPLGKSDTRIRYSEARLNSGTVYAKVFTVNEGPGKLMKDTYVIAFDDGDAAGTGEPDFQDLIIQISPVTASIPEFPTVALPVAAVLGLIFIFGRKKGDL